MATISLKRAKIIGSEVTLRLVESTSEDNKCWFKKTLSSEIPYSYQNHNTPDTHFCQVFLSYTFPKFRSIFA